MKGLLLKRIDNSESYKRLNIFLIAVAPLYLLLLAEFNHIQSLSGLAEFITGSATVFLYDIILLSLFSAAVLFLTRRLYVVVLSLGPLLFAVSCIEYFKYISTGTHFILPDLTLAANTEDIVRFAKLAIPAEMVFALISLLLFTIAVFWFNPVINLDRKKSIPIGIAALLVGVIIIATPLSKLLYKSFNISDNSNTNALVANKQFEDNELIAFLATNLSEQVETIMRAPDNYDEQTVQSLLKPEQEASKASRPNVVVVMNESYADLRRYDKSSSYEGIYDAFDRAAEKARKGTAVVPTFGGYTVRTEFELIFGLPVRGTGNSISPHSLLRDREKQPTMAQYFSDNGYHTAFIHPFNDTTYNRGKVYSSYGFDAMKFEGKLDVPDLKYHNYTDDGALYSQVMYEINNSEEPCYIHLTTMQNHLPYESGEMSEFEYYLEGLQHSGVRLEEFFNSLEKLDEDTIVLFIGDHLPYLSGENSLYKRIGLGGENYSAVYKQSYLMYNNFGLDISLPEPEVSTFYLPHIMINAIGLPQTPFISTMLYGLSQTPVYSIGQPQSNSLLDMLTYDRVKGKNYSSILK